jgi:Ala-tRNA(Pro) deacylase
MIAKECIMGMAMKLKDYLEHHQIHYEVVTHPRSHSSIQSAKLAHVPADRLAKPVILEDDNGYVMAVIPTTHHVKLGALSSEMQRNLRLATERELADLFKDCELGAIPPLGEIYGMPTIVDDELVDKPDVYFEAGDHEELIRVDHKSFLAMMASARRFHCSRQIVGHSEHWASPPIGRDWSDPAYYSGA